MTRTTDSSNDQLPHDQPPGEHALTSLANLTATTPGLPCRTTDPELWFSRSSSDRALAVALCQQCPLRRPCAQYAIDNDERGVWGGTTAADRRSFRDVWPWRFDGQGHLRLACGSEDAYRSHFGYQERPCEACVQAHEEHITAQRRDRLDEEHAAGGSVAGYFLHRRLGEPACGACLGAQRAASAAARRRKAGRGLRRARTASVTPGVTEALSGAPAGAHALPIAS
jgi:hypothetical protein